MRRQAILLVLALVGPASAQELSLYEAGRRALQNHPDQQVAAAGTEAAEARVGLAEAPYYPAFFGLLSYQQSEQALIPQAVPLRPFTDQFVNFRGSQLLADFGKRDGRYRSAESQLEASREQQRNSMQVRLARTGEAYYRLVRSLQLVQIESRALRLARAKLEDAHKLFKSDSARPDVSIFELDVNLATRGLLEASNAETLARIDLGLSMGGPGPFVGAVESSFLVEPEWPVQIALEQASQKRPEIQAAAHLLDSTRANLDATEAEYFPNVSLNANYSFYNRQMPLSLNAWRAGVDVSFPILNEPFLSESVALAESQVQAADAQQKAIDLQVEQEVRNSDVNLRQAHKQMRQAELGSLRALRSYVEIWCLYRLGQGTGREVSQAYRDFIEAQRGVANTEFAVRLAILERYRSAGQLDLQALKETRDVRVVRRSLVRPLNLPLGPFPPKQP